MFFFFNGTVLIPAIKSKLPPLYHSSLHVSGQYFATTPRCPCLSNPTMGPDRDAHPVLILTTLLLFSGFWSFGLGSRARITAPPGQGAEGAPTPSPGPSPAPAVQLLFQEQHVSGIILLSSSPCYKTRSRARMLQRCSSCSHLRPSDVHRKTFFFSFPFFS